MEVVSLMLIRLTHKMTAQCSVDLVNWPEAIPAKKREGQEAMGQEEEHITPVSL